jgi:acetylornithine deacetylase/succinyl-diaminopimelate desuccinylase-like protein
MHGTDILNALCFEPTCTISGLLTGYVGPGVKTVLPAKAVAKVSFRLPPDMSPEDTLEKLKKHMRTHGFDDIDVKSIGHMYALRCSVDDPIVQVTVESAREIFGTRTVLFPVCPASAHACYFIADRGWAGLPLVCTGVGYMQLEHSPNEYITTEQFRKGIEYSATIMQKFAQT